MKRYFPTVLAALIGLFVCMFLCRLFYGYATVPNALAQSVMQMANYQVASTSKSNYASIKYKREAQGAPQPVLVDQKYERIAETRCETSRFEEDEKALRAAIAREKGLIQYEQRQGRKGQRRLDFSIGVPPSNFDALYEALQKTGQVVATNITKTDKTNEYLDLKAKIAALEANLASLRKLKARPGSLDELMRLETRMLEVQDQLQGLGVSLGAFDEENEFNTIRFGLVEVKKRTISVVHRVKVAFEWTVKYYALLMFGLVAALVAAFVVVTTVERAQRIWSKL